MKTFMYIYMIFLSFKNTEADDTKNINAISENEGSEIIVKNITEWLLQDLIKIIFLTRIWEKLISLPFLVYKHTCHFHSQPSCVSTQLITWPFCISHSTPLISPAVSYMSSNHTSPVHYSESCSQPSVLDTDEELNSDSDIATFVLNLQPQEFNK